mmetsp:Transcript_12212/g.8889  ORF Transcript_12212/g.8889 Transcript_12212/m.8889 type:complete len:110 (+) Transcript_12212:495-824(+)
MAEDGVEKFQDCLGSKSIMEKYPVISNGTFYLEAIETKFECAAMCEESDFFTFSNISNGPPDHNCSSAVKHYMSRKVPILLFVFFFSSIFMVSGFVYAIKVFRDSKRWA